MRFGISGRFGKSGYPYTFFPEACGTFLFRKSILRQPQLKFYANLAAPLALFVYEDVSGWLVTRRLSVVVKYPGFPRVFSVVVK